MYLALLAPAAMARPALLYPATGSVDEERRSDVEGELKSAMLRRRSGYLTLGSTVTLPSSCGADPAPQCLAKLGMGDVVVVAAVSDSEGGLTVSLRAVEPDARVWGPVTVEITAATGSVGKLLAALDALDKAMLPPPSAPKKRAPAAAVPAPAEDAPASHATWMAPTGKWTAASGVAALLAGAVVGHFATNLNDDLSARYRTGALTAADLPSYPRLHRMTVAANALFIAGGALTLAGVVLWGVAPDPEPSPGGM